LIQGTYSKLVCKTLFVFGSCRLFGDAMVFKHSKALEHVEVQRRGEGARENEREGKVRNRKLAA
jgi:hypothetical protein